MLNQAYLEFIVDLRIVFQLYSHPFVNGRTGMRPNAKKEFIILSMICYLYIRSLKTLFLYIFLHLDSNPPFE